MFRFDWEHLAFSLLISNINNKKPRPENRDEALLRVTTLIVEYFQPLKRFIYKNRMCIFEFFLPKFTSSTLFLMLPGNIYSSFLDKFIHLKLLLLNIHCHLFCCQSN